MQQMQEDFITVETTHLSSCALNMHCKQKDWKTILENATT